MPIALAVLRVTANEPVWLLDWNISGLHSFQNLGHLSGSLTMHRDIIRAVCPLHPESGRGRMRWHVRFDTFI